jgi:hypothetical protein
MLAAEEDKGTDTRHRVVLSPIKDEAVGTLILNRLILSGFREPVSGT